MGTNADAAQGKPPSRALLERFAPLRPVAGVAGLAAHQAADVVGLWQEWERESGRRQPVPFWATVWPASVVLARAVAAAAVRVAGRRVLEIGCGCGVVAMAAARSGAASVEANDIDPVALEVARANARANRVELRTSGVDYAEATLPGMDVVLVADLFYERAPSERLLDRLRGAARAGALVFVADGGRPFAPQLALREVVRETVAVDAALEGVASRAVRVVQLL